MLNFVAVGTMAMSLLAGPAVVDRAEAVAPPVPTDKIQVSVVTVNGSGCPAGTASVAPAPDNTAFTVVYSQFLAQVGVGARPTDMRRNCQLAVRVQVPQGFTFAIAQVDYRGYAKLARGASGTERAGYYFAGMSATERVEHTFNGPYNNVWQTTDKAGVLALVYRPCGEERLVNINAELIVDAGRSNPRTTTSFMTMDSTDGSVNTVYHLSWKRCR
jgi:hypothetical protein